MESDDRSEYRKSEEVESSGKSTHTLGKRLCLTS